MKFFSVLALCLACLAHLVEAKRANSEWYSSSPGQFIGHTSHSDFISNHGTHNSLSKQLLLQSNGFQEINALIHKQMLFIESTLRNPFTVINCAFSPVAELTAQFDSFYDKSVDLRSIQVSAQAIIDNALKNKSLDAVALGAIYLKERATYALSNLEKQHAHVIDILAEKVAIESYNKADHESLLELYDRHARVKDQDLSRDKKVLKEIVEHYNLLEKELYALKNSSFIERSCHYFNRIFKGKPSLKKTIEYKQKELKNCYASCVEQEKALGGLKLDAKILENRIKQQAYSPEYKQSLEQLLSTKAGQEISPEYAASIKKTLEEHGALAKTTHAFSPEARNFLEESGYNLEEFSTCVGNSFEQHAHTALCELVEKTSSLPIHQEEGKLEVLHFASLSKDYMTQRQTSLALAAQKVGEALYECCVNTLDLGLAVAEGSFEAIKNSKNTINFLSDTAFSVPYDQKINKIISVFSNCAKAIGSFFKEQYQALTTEEGFKTWELNREIRGKKCAAWIQDIEERYAHTPLREKVKQLTAFVVENALLGKAVGYLLDTSRVIKIETQAIRLLDQELSLGKALPAITLQEINGVWQEVEKVNGVWRLVPEAAESHLPALTQIAQNNVSSASQIYQAKSKSIALVGLEKVVSSSVKPGFIDTSLLGLSKKVIQHVARQDIELFLPKDLVINGQQPLQLPKCITSQISTMESTVFFDIEHMYMPTIELNPKTGNIIKPTGFHIDFNGALENSGLIKVERVDNRPLPNGYYMAKISVNGSPAKTSTFFPQNFTYEKIKEVLYEALNNSISTTLLKKENGDWSILGHTNDGIPIRCMYKADTNKIHGFFDYATFIEGVFK